MSEMIDGYTAQKIKDFWMSQSDQDGVTAIITALYNEIQCLKKSLEQERKIREGLEEALKETVLIAAKEGDCFDISMKIEKHVKEALTQSPAETGEKKV